MPLTVGQPPAALTARAAPPRPRPSVIGNVTPYVAEEDLGDLPRCPAPARGTGSRARRARPSPAPRTAASPARRTAGSARTWRPRSRRDHLAPWARLRRHRRSGRRSRHRGEVRLFFSELAHGPTQPRRQTHPRPAALRPARTPARTTSGLARPQFTGRPPHPAVRPEHVLGPSRPRPRRDVLMSAADRLPPARHWPSRRPRPCFPPCPASPSPSLRAPLPRARRVGGRGSGVGGSAQIEGRLNSRPPLPVHSRRTASHGSPATRRAASCWPSVPPRAAPRGGPVRHGGACCPPWGCPAVPRYRPAPSERQANPGTPTPALGRPRPAATSTSACANGLTPSAANPSTSPTPPTRRRGAAAGMLAGDVTVGRPTPTAPPPAPDHPAPAAPRHALPPPRSSTCRAGGRAGHCCLRRFGRACS
ncbi:hypothetical protein TPAU25S_00902 [Tsukamurella paurometabola]